MASILLKLSFSIPRRFIRDRFVSFLAKDVESQVLCWTQNPDPVSRLFKTIGTLLTSLRSSGSTEFESICSERELLGLADVPRFTAQANKTYAINVVLLLAVPLIWLPVHFCVKLGIIIVYLGIMH